MSAPTPTEAQSDAADLARIRDHWTPRIIQAGAVYVGGFQVAYLWHDYGIAPSFALYLHVLNVSIAMGGFVTCLFPLGRTYGRSISFWGLTLLVVSMLKISVLTGDNDWFYVTLGLLSLGTSAMMPWEFEWQAALNAVVVAIVYMHWRYVPDSAASVHWTMIFMGVVISQTATALGQGYRRQLDEARLDALAASRAKSTFLSSMSHEIRTPMNAVLGMADLLLDTEPTDEQRHYLDVMISNGNSLLELINGILDLARIESGRMNIEKSDFDVTELIDNTIATFGVAAHTKSLELISRIAPDVPDRLIGDPLRVRQVLINLVGNAVKFTAEGQVVLEVCRDPDSSEPGDLRFAVSDTGIGIPADKLETIFASFTQADSSTTRQYGGTGLGLAIVKRLVGLMGGRIWVESVPNEGSTFFFTVKFGVVPGTSVSSARPMLDLTGERVLVVDDNHINRLIVREMISHCGAEVTEAASGAHALEAMRLALEANRPFRIVLLDMRMPAMDGLEVARRIRRQKLPGQPLIMMLSSEDFKPQLPRVRELGLDAYMVKPITRKRLFEAIGHVLSEPGHHAPGAAASREVVESADAPPPPVAASNILIADDSPDNRLLIAAYLKNEPYRIEYAENGNVAIEKFTANRYDVVFMDVQMPEMDGLCATRIIRKWEAAHGRTRTPIVALSAAALEEDVRQAIEAGCDLHVSKPVKKRVLLETIRHAAELMPAHSDDSASAAAR
ncbi:MAG TPA: response regulator [Candidatus Binataceae bacterium]|nr:response regulator [Candidatus Binataceae bacterium]